MATQTHRNSTSEPPPRYTEVDSTQESRFIEKWPKLASMLSQYHLTNPTRGSSLEDAARRFLSRGTKVTLPSIFQVDGEDVTYTLNPKQARDIIEACVDFLYSQQNPLNAKTYKEKNFEVIKGVITLTEQLFQHAVTNPDGEMIFHKITKTKKLQQTYHATTVKKLATRLTDITNTLKLLPKYQNTQIPDLHCLTLVEAAIQTSLKQVKLSLAHGFSGENFYKREESYDALTENKGAISDPNDSDEPNDANDINSPYDTYDSTDEENIGPSWKEEPTTPLSINPSQWIDTTFHSPTPFRETQRGNIASQPESWVWNYQEDPLQVILKYVSRHSTPSLRQAYGSLTASQTSQDYEIGTKALVVVPKNKNNPESLWKILSTITEHFPDDDHEESKQTIQKLDSARFVLNLEKLNKGMGIDHNAFLLLFQAKVSQLLENPKQPGPPKLRNELLIETLLETQKENGQTYNQAEAEIWLENLQTRGAGSYENSEAMENQRKTLLKNLNRGCGLLFNSRKNNFDKFQKQLKDFSTDIWKKLAGPTSQATRRELRHQLQLLKIEAKEKRDLPVLEKINGLQKFISSISSQIKSGQWHQPLELSQLLNPESSKNIEEDCQNWGLQKDYLTTSAKNHLENQKISTGRLTQDQIYKKAFESGWEPNLQEAATQTILETIVTQPRQSSLFFAGSGKPEPKSPITISLEFLKSYVDTKEKPTGEYLLNTVLKLMKEVESEEKGAKLQEDLKKISKNFNPKKSAKETAQNHKESYEPALELAQAIHNIPNSLSELAEPKNQEKLQHLCEEWGINKNFFETNAQKYLQETSNNTHPESDNELFQTAWAEGWRPHLSFMNHLFQNSLRLVTHAHREPPFEPQEIPDDLPKEEVQLVIQLIKKSSAAVLETQNPKCPDGYAVIRQLQSAYKQRDAGLSLAASPLSEKYHCKGEILDALKELEESICKTWRKNYLFWKGVQHIALSIKARKEDPQIQVSSSLFGTLDNILSITGAKSKNRVAGLQKNRETPTQNKQFQLSAKRAALVFGIATRLSLWLAKKEKGVKTIITQQDFEQKLKESIASCNNILNNQSETIERDIMSFQALRAENLNTLNRLLIGEGIDLLKSPEELCEAIRWIQKNPEIAKTLQHQNSKLDTPKKIWDAYQESTPSKTKKTAQLATSTANLTPAPFDPLAPFNLDDLD